MLFEDPALEGLTWVRDMESYYNLKITKVDVTIEGGPNLIYSQGLCSYQVWDKAKKLFISAPSNKRNPQMDMAEKSWLYQTLHYGLSC